MTDELVPLCEDWSLWPIAGLRSAGTGADRVLALGGSGDGPASAEEVTAAVESFARDPWFHEALVWQNPDMVRTWLADYRIRLHRGDATLSRRSYRQGVIARYAQRYATKNDTIGFFGPIGWARVRPDADLFVAVRGQGRETRRSAHFEAWAMEVIAQRIAADDRVATHFPPRRDLSARLRGDRLVRPRRSTVLLSPDEVAVWQLCDGARLPDDILALVRDKHPRLGFRTVSEVLSIIAHLRRRRLVHQTPRLSYDERMAEQLVDQLAAIPDEHARAGYLRPMRRLLAMRDDVVAAAGHPERLLSCLDALGSAYEELTTSPARHSRQSRKTGRSLLWSESLADWDVTVGQRALEALAVPMGMMLAVCRWLTWRVSTEIEDRAVRAVGATADGRVAFGVLLAELAPQLTASTSDVLRDVVGELHATVSTVLSPFVAGTDLELDTAAVRDRWHRAFAAPAPGWEGARMHSPDMLLASGRDTGPRWVLGEIHVAVNTLDNRFCVANQAWPGAIESLVARSTAAPRYVPAVAAQWPGVTPRTYPPLTVSVPDRFVYWALEPDDVLPPDLPRIPCGGLDVVVHDGKATVTDHDGLRVAFPEFIGELLSFLVGNAFQLFPRERFVPRVVLDDVVVQRRTWHLPVAEFQDLSGRNRESALLARLRDQGVPRHVFVQVPGDSKPVFCDLHSPPLAGNILRLVNRAAHTPGDVVRVQEMFPGFDQLWLTGDSGDRRTSEFRFVATDRRGAGVPA